jgi:hypothetical protein
VIPFIVSGAHTGHNFSMSQSAKDELLPWVVGGVLLIATTIAVAAIAGSRDDQAAAIVQSSDSRPSQSPSAP